MAKQVAEVEIHATKSSDKDLEDLDISVHQVDDRLFLGNLACARDYKTLGELQITHILTLDLVPLPRSILDHTDLTFKFIKLADVPKEDLISRLPEALEFIKEAIGLEKNVLVHCYFGVSRSAAVVIAYMMERHGLSYEDTLALVKQKRRFVCPNAGFVAQLKLFAQMGFKIDKDDPRYKQFRLKMAGQKLKQVKILPQQFADLVKADPGLARERPEPRVYRCRRCRRVLAAQRNIIPHVPKQVKVQWAKKGMRPPPALIADDGEGLIEKLRTLACQILDTPDPSTSSGQACHNPTRHDPTGHNPTGHNPTGHNPTGHNPTGHNPTGHNSTGYEDTQSDQEQREKHAEDWTNQALDGYTENILVDESIAARADPGVCRLVWFVEPLAWMTGVSSQASGKLTCPKCKAKIGSFSWVMGSNSCYCFQYILWAASVHVGRRLHQLSTWCRPRSNGQTSFRTCSSRFRRSQETRSRE